MQMHIYHVRHINVFIKYINHFAVKWQFLLAVVSKGNETIAMV